MPAVAFFPDAEVDAGKAFVGIEAQTRAALSRDPAAGIATNVLDRMGRGLVLPAPISRSPAEITALFLKHVLADACTRGIHIDGDALTLTVPVGFTQAQRSDTLLALRIAMNDLGLRLPNPARPEQMLISEPVAALLDFIAADLKRDELHRRIEYDRGPSLLVYDMGSNTLDLTLIRLMQINRRFPITLRNLRFEIIATSPDNPVGAADFNQCVAKALFGKLLEKYPDLENITLTNDERRYLHTKLVDDAERLKTELNQDIDWNGSDASVSFNLSTITLGTREYLLDGLTVTFGDYVTWTESLLQTHVTGKHALHPIEESMLNPIGEFLQNIGKSTQEIDYMLGISGMMAFLPLRANLKEWWNRPKSWLDTSSPSHAAAQGAAIYSALKLLDPEFTIEHFS
jgi:molecular chaperone DnaK (HSP70)